MVYVEPKSAGEVQDYAVDWSNELAQSETISSVTWTVPAGITKDSDSESSGITTIDLSGGTAGEEYEILCSIVTSDSRTYEKTIIVPVTQD